MINNLKSSYSETVDEIVELKTKLWPMIGYGLVGIIYFAISFLLIIYSFGIFSKEKVWWTGLITLPMGLLFVLDLPLFINHLFFEAFRTVTFNKTAKILTIERFGKVSIIDLKNDNFKAIRYIPRISIFEKAPGQGFGKIVLTRGNERYAFSETILDKSYLWLNLLKQNSKENIKEVKWQYNFIW